MVVAIKSKAEQEEIYCEAMTRLKPFENLIDVKRVTTVEASRTVRHQKVS